MFGVPSVREFCETPDLEHEPGWVELNPTRSEIMDYGPFSPPIRGYWRTPLNLSQHGTQVLLGRRITRVRQGLGTYGMGGCGWIGFELENSPPLLLICTIQKYGSQVKIVGTEVGLTNLTVPVNWVIRDIQLTEVRMEITGSDVFNNATFSIVAENPEDRRSMDQLWSCCRPDAEHWSWSGTIL